MRQSQKNNRTRSRGGRKPSNPLSRSYDSNGPDVKIRGTANHIAEKYQNLARDASVSGDIVMAENYYQHAEHYLRIIAAAQPTPREDNRPSNNSGNGEHANNDRSNRQNQPAAAEVPTPEIKGNEPQPPVSEPETTAAEMEVAVVDPIPGEGEQPAVTPVAKSEDEAAAPAAPRRRRRTTYRPRKRPTASENGGEAAPKKSKPAPSEAPQPVAADD